MSNKSNTKPSSSSTNKDRKNSSKKRREESKNWRCNDKPQIDSASRDPTWQQRLLRAMNDPRQVVWKDDWVVVMKDMYPKAQHHFMVLPKKDILNVKALTAQDLPIVKYMHKVAVRYTEQFPCTEFKFGYHAVPHLERLHLHVISTDLDSPCLKTKNHWLRFTTRFFINSEDVIRSLEKYGKVDINEDEYLKLVDKNVLSCHKCKFLATSIDIMKNHVKEHLEPIEKITTQVPVIQIDDAIAVVRLGLTPQSGSHCNTYINNLNSELYNYPPYLNNNFSRKRNSYLLK